MNEFVDYSVRYLAWIVYYTETIDGAQYDFAPPKFTFEEKPTEAVLETCRAEARAAFERKRNGSV